MTDEETEAHFGAESAGSNAAGNWLSLYPATLGGTEALPAPEGKAQADLWYCELKGHKGQRSMPQAEVGASGDAGGAKGVTER